jgi:GNAT superfamily N-acetyltransferase
MEWARQHRDGKLMPSACLAAWTRDEHAGEKQDENEEWICGAALVGLVPTTRLSAPAEAGALPDPDHPDDPRRRRVPHLDWMFVNQWMHRQGIGTMLLESVVNALRVAGFRTLASTSLQGNTQSLLWHWRNGFNEFALRRRRQGDQGEAREQ